jgi:hypothetical protein
VLRKKKPGVAITGIDLVIENIETAQADCSADGTITCATVAASDTVIIDSVTLTAAGAQTGSGLNFDETAGSDADVATSLVAAINDAGNGLNGIVTADNESGTSAVVKVTAVTPGTGGNSLALASSNGTTLAVEAATLTGGVNPSDFKVAGVWDALLEDSPAWDFVVSCNCVWAYTESRMVAVAVPAYPGDMVSARALLFQLLDAKATKGWAVLGATSHLPLKLADLMTAARSSSTGLADSYFTEDEGARATLLSGLVGERLHPVWIQRDSTSSVAPVVHPLLCATADESLVRYNNTLSRQDRRRAIQAEAPAPTTIKGLATGATIAPSLAITPE